MLQKLKSILKILFSDARQTIVGIIVVGLVGSIGGLLYLSKTALSFSIAILKTKTPLWAAIALVLLVGVYIRKYLSLQKTQHKPNFPHACGALWDENFDPRCMYCGSLLKHSSLGPAIFFCSDIKCNNKHILRDEFGNLINKDIAIKKLKRQTNNQQTR